MSNILDKNKIDSPNVRIEPKSARVNEQGHLELGGIDATELAAKFGTPLWIVDEQTICDAVNSIKLGLSEYPQYTVLFACKSFCCLAMLELLHSYGLGLDVVSIGEIYSAQQVNFPANQIYFNGNNKTKEDITMAVTYGDIAIVIDSISELHMVASLGTKLNKSISILLRLTPDVELDTHDHIRTGSADSKFGIELNDFEEAIKVIKSNPTSLKLIGLHAHIGSQGLDLPPYLEMIDVMAGYYAKAVSHGFSELSILDLGGGLGISYTVADKPLSLYNWSREISQHLKHCFTKYQIPLPHLVLEPGRSIIGSAGVTLYRAGHYKKRSSGVAYLAVDGGMADNPRPITYQAEYTACIANNMNLPNSKENITLVGKFCESGDVIIKDTTLAAQPGDLIAVFGTGAYNYSMSSNYNRTARPACILVNAGQADIVIERETLPDLIRQDRIPLRLQNNKKKD